MVKKTAKISAPVIVENLGDQVSLELNATNEYATIQLASLFVLLKEKLAELVEFNFNGCSIFLKVSEENHSFCSFYNLHEKVFKLSISVNELEFCLFYLLKYYRDGIADVNHVDLDFEFSNTQIVTWTISIDNFNQQSIDEIHNILGIS